MKIKEALEDEIAFWQSLIERQPHDSPGEVIERMTQARMLAEQKLSLLNCKRRVGAPQSKSLPRKGSSTKGITVQIDPG